MKELGIYIHMPFCKSKCYYCDFISYPNAEEYIEKYIEKLNLEIDSELNKIDKYKIKTIYIGGGTPSICNANLIEKLKIMNYVRNDVEFTIEINPGTITKEKLQKYKEMGVNRLSIGMQSTNNKILKEIGRIHTYEEFLKTFKLARQLEYKNINVDLMIGLPNQTLNDVEESTNKIIELNPEHISAYSLILEKGTRLEKLVDARRIKSSE